MKRICTFDVLLSLAAFAVTATWCFLHVLGFRHATAFLTITDSTVLGIGLVYASTWLATVTVVPVILLAVLLKAITPVRLWKPASERRLRS